jgi:hypothetical protein
MDARRVFGPDLRGLQPGFLTLDLRDASHITIIERHGEDAKTGFRAWSDHLRPWYEVDGHAGEI